MMRNYFEVRNWLENFIPYTYSKENLGLERIRNLLAPLGNPQDKFKSIHVAGTSGKGSTAYYIARLLQFSENSENSVSRKIGKLSKSESQKVRISDNTDSPIHRDTESSEYSGLKIGLHLSPHLVDIRERMQIFSNQKPETRNQKQNLMPMRRFIGLVNAIKPVVDEIISRQPHLTPSYFEILVAAAFKYFADEKVDWAVVEVGLGGRLDATNVLQSRIAVITNVGLDHTEILGNTIEEIAYEKAGIIKESRVESRESKGGKARLKARPFVSQTSSPRPGLGLGVPVVTGATGKALKVIEKVARLASAPLIQVEFPDKSEPRRAKAKGAKLITVNTQHFENLLKSDLFKLLPIYSEILRDSHLQLAFSNKLLAITAVSELGIKINSAIIKNLFKEQFVGRFEEIEQGVIIDGAHNAAKVNFLINGLKERLSHSNYSNNQSEIILVLAFKHGKDWKKMVDLLIENLHVKKVIATKFYAVTDTGRFSAVEPREIADIIKSKWKVKVESFDNSQEAVFEALRLRSGSTTVLMTGSLYLVGEARTMWYPPEF